VGVLRRAVIHLQRFRMSRSTRHRLAAALVAIVPLISYADGSVSAPASDGDGNVIALLDASTVVGRSLEIGIVVEDSVSANRFDTDVVPLSAIPTARAHRGLRADASSAIAPDARCFVSSPLTARAPTHQTPSKRNRATDTSRSPR